jgi:hypothetical protein
VDKERSAPPTARDEFFTLFSYAHRMTHQAPPASTLPGGDPGRQVASLREALILVRGICGEPDEPTENLLEEAAWFSSAYERATPVLQRRFDALSEETAAWAAAGVEALLTAGSTPPAAPATRLAGALEDSLAQLKRLLSH